MLKSVDNELSPGDVIRAHRICRPYKPKDAGENRVNNVSKLPRQIIVKLQDHLKAKRDLKYIRINEDIQKERNAIAYKARQLSIEHWMRDTWTVDGQILVKDNQL